MSADEDFKDRVATRIALGEVHVICNECGARLWSADARPGETHDRDISCPYKSNPDLARKYGCETRDSAYYPVTGHWT